MNPRKLAEKWLRSLRGHDHNEDVSAALEEAAKVEEQQAQVEAPTQPTTPPPLSPREQALAWKAMGQEAGGNRPTDLQKLVEQHLAAQQAPFETPAPQPAAPSVAALPVPPAAPVPPVAQAPKPLTWRDFPRAAGAARVPLAGPEHAAELNADVAAVTTESAVRSGAYAARRANLLRQVPNFTGLVETTPPVPTSTGILAGGLQPPNVQPAAPPAYQSVEHLGGGLTIPHGHRTVGPPSQLLLAKRERQRALRQLKGR